MQTQLLTPKQERMLEVKKAKKAHKNYKRFNGKAYIDERLDTVDRIVNSNKGDLRNFNSKEATVILLPRMLRPEVVLYVNYRMLPDVHFKATGQNKKRNNNKARA